MTVFCTKTVLLFCDGTLRGQCEKIKSGHSFFYEMGWTSSLFEIMMALFFTAPSLFHSDTNISRHFESEWFIILKILYVCLTKSWIIRSKSLTHVSTVVLLYIHGTPGEGY